jgi:TPR repeat protein
MRFSLLLVGLLGCSHGLDRTESAVPLTASRVAPESNEARGSAMTTLARACESADPDPRAMGAYERACSSGNGDACAMAGLAHLCGANGEANDGAALPMFVRACRMKSARGCHLLEATQVVVHRAGHVASLLD